ncbi:hypothetical protein GGR28_001981 [Lewinella aquimaris]|uniref:Right handed beta helix domain-containing protein n=1 Tax=Neolewinella aquimaris TaxID=1835722 RepID=A0A840E2B8_9BACT|nr:hypothetical protein [Neolewinella aquimaris]MBB4079361.1 hypothetical protein [Neolewinella aquimaris]
MTTLTSPYLLALFSIFFSLISLVRGNYDPPPGSVIYVDANAGRSGTGSSWDTPISTLQDALLRADHDRRVREIRMAGGTYFSGQRSDTLTPSSFLITAPNISIVGGYRGGGRDGNERDPLRYPTRLAQLQNGASILSIRFNSGHTRLDGLIIGNPPNSCVRTNIGLDVYHSQVSAINCRFEGIKGRPDRHVAGVRLEGSQPTSFTNCLFTNNLTTDTGGDSQLLYHGVCNFNFCPIHNRSGGSGGASAHTKHATTQVHLDNCVIYNNADAAGQSIHSGRNNVVLQFALTDLVPAKAQALTVTNGITAASAGTEQYFVEHSKPADNTPDQFGLR